MRHHLILKVITKLLVAPIVMFALYVQFHGDYSPGGGFQAGVIYAVAFILYGTVFSLRNVQRVMPPNLVYSLLALGVLIYIGTGFAGLILGGEFLNYSVLAHDPEHGQHYGILIVELGVGITVANVMIAIYYAFAGRTPVISDQDW